MLSDSELENFYSKLAAHEVISPVFALRQPVHVVYGGAHLFKAGTSSKLGELALKSLEAYAPNFVELADAIWLKGCDTLPKYEALTHELEFQLSQNPQKIKTENYPAWFAWTVHNRVIEKLKTEPIEDFRVDFEDGYGFRHDGEEDGHAITASTELADAFLQNKITPFCGIRIKALSDETAKRAIRTLSIFLTNLLEKTSGKMPDNFVVTLPKITCTGQVSALAELLDTFESKAGLPNGAIKIEIMIETPESIYSSDGRVIMPELVMAAKGRCTSAHFGAYDFTSDLGIVAEHQHLRHEACNFARQIMLTSLTPLGIRLSDSVTAEMPIPIHKGENLTSDQVKENAFTVRKAWRTHFNNITHSLINGFYQSWDLHPAQLVARYAAVYAFFLESADLSAKRLKGFAEKAAQAMTTGNVFDDLASAEGLMNFFKRAQSSGAMTEDEIIEITGLTANEFKAGSFKKMVEKRISAVG